MTCLILRVRIFVLSMVVSVYPSMCLTTQPLSTVFTSTLERINGASNKVNVENGDTGGSYDSRGSDSSSLSGDGINGREVDTLPESAGRDKTLLERWPGFAGETALRQVQFLASKVSESTDAADESKYSLEKRLQRTGVTTVPFATDGNREIDDRDRRRRRNKKKKDGPAGEGGGVFNNAEYNTVMAKRNDDPTGQQNTLLGEDVQVSSSSKREEQVWTALANLEVDMQLLDNLAGQKPQLTVLELFMLTASVTAAASGPWVLGGKLTEFLAPTAAAFSAAIGIGAEYVGRVAVSDGKEVAAATIGCAAEAEGLLANAERAKAITPLCVGVGATATSFSLLVPVLFESLDTMILNDLYLACPLVSVLAAAVCSLALQDTRLFSQRAASVGNRRFARSGLVGRTWLSAAEQIVGKSNSNRRKWRTFSLSVLPAPILGSLIPGTSLATKSIIVTALAAAQTAALLAQCEYSLSRATDAVAIKARSAAVCDTYANQGARSSAILPFTSALSGLCAAATAAVVELPFLESLSSAGSFASLASEMAIVALFPAFSSLFAAAASVSKARCEVQAEAAVQAASTLALEYTSNDDDDPILRPFRGVIELIRLTYQSSILEPCQRLWRRIQLAYSRGRGLFRGSGGSLPGNSSIKRNADSQALAYLDAS